jgi:hypothetical protein
MRHLCNILVVLGLLFSVGAAAAEPTEPSANEASNTITRTYQANNFDAICNRASADIEFTQTTDGSSSARAIGPAYLVERLKVTVIEGVLTITRDTEKGGKRKNTNQESVRFEISAPTLKSIESYGVGDVEIEGGLRVKNLSITSKGVGDVEIKNLECSTLNVTSSGVGDVELTGHATTADLTLKGVGDINAYKFKVDNLTVYSTGMGDVECYATSSIKAESRGVGGIKYKGSPKERKITSKGIGGIDHKH